MTRQKLRSDKAATKVQVNTKVGEPPIYLYTKVGEPPLQSRCKSSLLLEKEWMMTEFGAEEHTSNILLVFFLIYKTYD